MPKAAFCPLSPCYVCLDTDGDTVPSPCSCQGTLGRVHPSCLSEWLASEQYVEWLRDQFLSDPLWSDCVQDAIIATNHFHSMALPKGLKDCMKGEPRHILPLPCLCRNCRSPLDGWLLEFPCPRFCASNHTMTRHVLHVMASSFMALFVMVFILIEAFWIKTLCLFAVLSMTSLLFLHTTFAEKHATTAVSMRPVRFVPGNGE